jgi:hypothetical protein
MLTTSKTCPPTPAEAKALAERLLSNLSGNELHKAFDQASNAILSSLGYSDFVDAFVRAVNDYHGASSQSATAVQTEGMENG